MLGLLLELRRNLCVFFPTGKCLAPPHKYIHICMSVKKSIYIYIYIDMQVVQSLAVCVAIDLDVRWLKNALRIRTSRGLLTYTLSPPQGINLPWHDSRQVVWCRGVASGLTWVGWRDISKATLMPLQPHGFLLLEPCLSAHTGLANKEWTKEPNG